MAKDFDITPHETAAVQTEYRRIQTEIPAPQTVEVLETLRRCEPRAMGGQPPILWDRAEGFQVWDTAGNCWIDFSCGVLITNAGHGRKEISEALIRTIEKPLLTNYCFPSEIRAALTAKLVELAPDPCKKVFLLSTGSEAVECTVKLCRERSRRTDPQRKLIVSFERAFHGRTLASQMIGGWPALKEWIGNLDPDMIQVPFPDGFRTPDTRFESFTETLEAAGVGPEGICGVVIESYQGNGASFAPPEYMQQLRRWCDENDILLVMDEIQSAFGRTGTFWGFEHYGVVPDLYTVGKGISSSLPISAVIGRADVMDLFPPGSMTSTHTGNPLCCAAALANIELLLSEDLIGNSARLGAIMHEELGKLKTDFPDRIGAVHGKGLVAGIHLVKGPDQEPDGELAWQIVNACMDAGVLMFSPVGLGSATVKINPPLCITKPALIEGLGVFRDAFADAMF